MPCGGFGGVSSTDAQTGPHVADADAEDSHAIATSYDTPLVVLSILIAVLASYSALDLVSRARGATAAYRPAWIGMAALVMRGGIWASTVLSFLVAVAATGAASIWVSRRRARTADALPAGLLMGGGVAVMHYTGMAAMEMPAAVTHNGWTVALSVLIAGGRIHGGAVAGAAHTRGRAEAAGGSGNGLRGLWDVLLRHVGGHVHARRHGCRYSRTTKW